MLHISKIRQIIQNDDCTLFRQSIGCSENLHLNPSYLNVEILIQAKHKAPLIHLCAQYDAHKICLFICQNCTSVNEQLINAQDAEGKTALHVCAIFGSIKCMQVLLANGAKVDSLKRGEWTPLMIALTKENLLMVRLLLTNGADPTLCNKDGWNAAHLATRTGNLSLVALLEKHSQMHQLQHMWQIKSKNGRSVLHIASMHNHLELIQNFLDVSVVTKNIIDWQSKDCCGVTPFMDAARINSLSICRFLWHHSDGNLNVNQVDLTGRSALHMAAQTNAVEVIHYLVNCLQADIDLQDKWGQTPLFLSIREGHEEATKLLIELGAGQLLDCEKRSPLDIATQYGHLRLLHALQLTAGSQ